jgi:methylphosphotriester-DNA--protein-cysteine methyltransferase
LTRAWTLIGADGRPYEGDVPGEPGGHRRTKIYGRLDCRGARQAIPRGGNVANTVFFRDEAAATDAGYRPCAVSMPAVYRTRKEGRA